MTDEERERNEKQNESHGQDVTAGKGRRDEVGRTGIYPSSGPYPEGPAPVITPADINEPHDRKGPGVERNEELQGSSRLPRKGNELDKPESDQLGD